MSTLEELENKYKELGEEIEKLKAEKENETGKLEHGDVYWFINHIGEIKLATWYGDPEDKTRYELGNVFIARWEASFKVEQLKVEAELRRFARPFVSNNRNYCLRYTHNSKVMYIEYFSSIQNSDIYFNTAEIAQKAIDTVGEERIKKYYFGIDE